MSRTHLLISRNRILDIKKCWINSKTSPHGSYMYMYKVFWFSTLYTTVPCHTRNWKNTDSLLLSRTPSVLKTVTVDTNIWYYGTKKHILWRSTLILKQVFCRWHHQDARVSSRQRSSSRQSALQWIRIVSLFSPTTFVLIGSRINIVLALNGKETASRLNITYRYIDNVLSINNPEFENNLGHRCILFQFEIKGTTESTSAASYLDLLQ